VRSTGSSPYAVSAFGAKYTPAAMDSTALHNRRACCSKSVIGSPWALDAAARSVGRCPHLVVIRTGALSGIPAAVARFVIQHHAARALHYDFRLEVGGTLKSWAVPKGLSTDPREKRLAVQVPDHALEHADYEGARVIVWDRGTWRSLTEGPVEEALARGHLSFWLEGEKLRGGWTLQRTHAGAKPQWLVIKRRDEGADARRDPVSTQPESVLSGRTLDEVG
jgi:DNA ligase D-like protein (predicted 3'-phosphoesterase)